MVKLAATFIVSASVGLGVAGCGPPAPPWRVNCSLPKHAAIYREEPEVCEKADVVIVAQCTRLREYAKRVRGDWVQHWYVTQWWVVQVERGQWPDSTVDFVFCDSWPTPESGIVLRAPPPVYYKGAVIAFCVDTSGNRTVVVAQEQRSRIPPYGRVRRPPRDFYDFSNDSSYQRVIAAVNRYIGDSRSRVGPRGVMEEYDDFYVVEIGNAMESEVVTVDKRSFQVRPVATAHEVTDDPVLPRP